MLNLHKLSKSYSTNTVALATTSLRLERGSFTVLLGQSGAGKSTLLRCMNMLETPSEGQVISDSLGVLDTPAKIREHRRRTAMIFQQHQLLPRMTSLQNALLGRIGSHSMLRMLFPLPEEECKLALNALARVGLLEKADTQVRHLSGGQQQRVGIARALVQQPDMILADEPVASLDPASADRVLELLREICRERNIAVVASLHQVELARRFADRIVGLEHGHIVLDTDPASLDDTQLNRLYAASHNSPLLGQLATPMAA